jgi:hypothetical protein
MKNHMMHENMTWYNLIKTVSCWLEFLFSQIRLLLSLWLIWSNYSQLILKYFPNFKTVLQRQLLQPGLQILLRTLLQIFYWMPQSQRHYRVSIKISVYIQLYPKKAGFRFGFRFFQPKPKLEPKNWFFFGLNQNRNRKTDFFGFWIKKKTLPLAPKAL